MRIHRTTHQSAYLTVSNRYIQDHRISFGARGLYAYLLSLPNGAQVDVRTLSDASREGRRTISRWLHELRDAGLYTAVVYRSRTTGQIATKTDLYEVPPVPAMPGDMTADFGHRAGGSTGDQPSVESTWEMTPPTVPVDDEPAEEADGGTEPAPEGPGEGGEAESPEEGPELGLAVSVLAKIAHSDPRLTLGMKEIMKLAPMVAEWQDRGASNQQISTALTAGLPAMINHPKALLRHRLEQKMPPRPASIPSQDRPLPLAYECTDCQTPIREPGTCGNCQRTGHVDPAPFVSAAQRGAAAIRAALRGVGQPIPA